MLFRSYLARILISEKNFGYLLIDINPQYITGYFSSAGDAAIIKSDNVILKCTDGIFTDSNFITAVPYDSTRAKNYSGYRLYRLRFCEENSIMVAVSTEALAGQILSFAIPIAILFVFLISISVLISQRLTGSISRPLVRLYHIMNDEHLEPVISRPLDSENRFAFPPDISSSE